MAQFRRDYFELKRAEAVDIADPRSFAVHRKTSVLTRPEYRPRKPFCTLHSNRNCYECKKKKILTQKKPRQRTLGMDILMNDYNGFHWIDPKVNEFQTLNVAGKGIKSSTDIPFHNSGLLQNNRLFFPELAFSNPVLVARQAGVYRKGPREKRETLEGSRDKDCLPLFQEASRKRKENFENKEPFKPVLYPLPTERKDSVEGFEKAERLSLLDDTPGYRKEGLASFDNARMPVFKYPSNGQTRTLQGGGDKILGTRLPDIYQDASFCEMKILESRNKERRRINVILPRISNE